jgi:hypothetical protein
MDAVGLYAQHATRNDIKGNILLGVQEEIKKADDNAMSI